MGKKIRIQVAWFGHMERHPLDTLVLLKDILFHFTNILKKCDKTKRTLMETTRKNRAKLELNVNMIYNKMKWKERNYNLDLNSLRSGVMMTIMTIFSSINQG